MVLEHGVRIQASTLFFVCIGRGAGVCPAVPVFGCRALGAELAAMSKHSKHAHTRPTFSGAEVAKAMALYGTQKAHLTADSQRPWDCCSLTLVPVVDPVRWRARSSVGSHIAVKVCTPQGYLFSYEAILHNLLEQKQRYKRDLKAFKKQQSAGAGVARVMLLCGSADDDDARRCKESQRWRACQTRCGACQVC